jgi:hypothetical protein
MKKLLTLLFIGVLSWGYAQNFQLKDAQGNTFIDGQTIAASITEDDLDILGEFVIKINVHNLTSNVLEMNTLRTNVALNEKLSTYVCFLYCYDDDLEIPGEIEAGEIDEYSLHLVPDTCYCYFGLNQFILEFWSEENQNDKITLYVNIDMTPLGVKDLSKNNVSLSIYPNPAPAHSLLNLSYTITEKTDEYRLIIRNILGAPIINLPLNSYENCISVDISTLASGVYICTIENKNQISVSKKLIVK